MINTSKTMNSYQFCVFLCYGVLSTASAEDTEVHHPLWLVNYPSSFRNGHGTGKLIDVTNDSSNMTIFERFVDNVIMSVDGYTDGEIVDSLEHFFWGKTLPSCHVFKCNVDPNPCTNRL
jgi:hypothetical protein